MNSLLIDPDGLPHGWPEDLTVTERQGARLAEGPTWRQRCRRRGASRSHGDWSLVLVPRWPAPFVELGEVDWVCGDERNLDGRLQGMSL